jgi:elongator complex protein 3
MFKKLFKDESFKPDQLKIYPCQVIKGAKLENHYKKKKFKPCTKETLEKLLIKIMKLIPNYCRVMRVMREIPPDFLTAGILRIDLRRDIDNALKKSKSKISEIRFREIGFTLRDKLPKQKINTNLKLKTTKYKASDGDEYFLEFTNKDNILFGLLRLRISNSQSYIREIHIYGQALPIGKKPKNLGQHSGLGKKLILEAENITKKNKIKTLKIISGIGVRKYFEKFNYKLDKEKVYMEKNLN